MFINTFALLADKATNIHSDFNLKETSRSSTTKCHTFEKIHYQLTLGTVPSFASALGIS